MDLPSVKEGDIDPCNECLKHPIYCRCKEEALKDVFSEPVPSEQPADSKATLVPFECRPPIEQSLINDYNRLQSKYDSLISEVENWRDKYYSKDGLSYSKMSSILQKHRSK